MDASVLQPWLLPLATVLSSLIMGLLVVMGTRVAPTQLVQASLPADLDEQLSHCLAQLRDLRDQAPRLQPEAYALQRQIFESRAADLLRQREAATNTAPGAAAGEKMGQDVTPTIRFLAQRPALRLALWTGGITLVVAALGYLVWTEQRPRLQDTSSPQAAPQSPNTEVSALMAGLQKAPNDAPMLLRLAHILLREQMLEQAKTVNDRALALQPQSVEGRVHQAVLIAASGQQQGAAQALDALTSAHGGFAEGWFFRGMLALQAGDKARMRTSFERYLQVEGPGPQRDRIEAMLRSAAP